MATLKDITLYALCKNTSLSRSEMAKIVYLVDYFHAKKYTKQYTAIKWFHDDYGPFVRDVENSIANVDGVIVTEDKNLYGSRAKYYSYNKECPEMPEELKSILDHVIVIHKEHNYTSFIDYVYQTSPVKMTKKNRSIDIEKCVKAELDNSADESFDETVRAYDDVMKALAQ